MLKLREHEYSYILLDVDGLTAGSELLDSIATRPNVILITDTDSEESMPPVGQHLPHAREAGRHKAAARAD